MQPAHAKGLKIYLSVNTNLAGQGVEIDTFQFGNWIYTHTGYINNGFTKLTLEYPENLVRNGEFEICAYGVHADFESCSFGYNGKESKPEYVTVELYGSNMPSQQSQPQQGGQSQSQSTENTIIICQQERCEVQ
jgi:hypothetical protein